MSLLHVNEHSTEAGNGGGLLLARHLKLGDKDVAEHGSEKSLLGECDKVFRGAAVDRVELVVDGVVVERVADREFVAFCEEEGAERSVCVEKSRKACRTVHRRPS